MLCRNPQWINPSIQKLHGEMCQVRFVLLVLFQDMESMCMEHVHGEFRDTAFAMANQLNAKPMFV